MGEIGSWSVLSLVVTCRWLYRCHQHGPKTQNLTAPAILESWKSYFQDRLKTCTEGSTPPSPTPEQTWDQPYSHASSPVCFLFVLVRPTWRTLDLLHLLALSGTASEPFSSAYCSWTLQDYSHQWVHCLHWGHLQLPACAPASHSIPKSLGLIPHYSQHLNLLICFNG